MSSILDALQKSERARAQQRQQASFALNRPEGSREILPCAVPNVTASMPSAPWLLLGLFIGIVLVLLAVIALLLWQPRLLPPAPAVPSVVMLPTPWSAPPSATVPPAVSDAVASLPLSPPPLLPEVPAVMPLASVQLPASTTAPTAPAAPAANTPLPSLADLPFELRRQLPALELDIHAYDPLPEKRFVFINLVRYGQGDYLKPDLLLQEITREGVILRFQEVFFRVLLE
jgi:general secretion pathway protein B